MSNLVGGICAALVGLAAFFLIVGVGGLPAAALCLVGFISAAVAAWRYATPEQFEE